MGALIKANAILPFIQSEVKNELITHENKFFITKTSFFKNLNRELNQIYCFPTPQLFNKDAPK